MEKIYSNEVKGNFTFQLSEWDKWILNKAYIKEIKRLNDKIKRIENNPKNEGQATFLCDIDTINFLIKECNECIDMLTKQ